MKLSDNMKRMHRNACACGKRGFWVHGRAELSTAKALERRGLVTIDRTKGRLGDFTSSLMPVMVYAVQHDMENCNCHECRTFRWRERMNKPKTEVVGAECLYHSETVFKIVEDCGFDKNGRSVTIRHGDSGAMLQAHISQLKAPLI
jgi:hypothetical protein